MEIYTVNECFQMYINKLTRSFTRRHVGAHKHAHLSLSLSLSLSHTHTYTCTHAHVHTLIKGVNRTGGPPNVLLIRYNTND